MSVFESWSFRQAPYDVSDVKTMFFNCSTKSVSKTISPALSARKRTLLLLGHSYAWSNVWDEVLAASRKLSSKRQMWMYGQEMSIPCVATMAHRQAFFKRSCWCFWLNDFLAFAAVYALSLLVFYPLMGRVPVSCLMSRSRFGANRLRLRCLNVVRKFIVSAIHLNLKAGLVWPYMFCLAWQEHEAHSASTSNPINRQLLLRLQLPQSI